MSSRPFHSNPPARPGTGQAVWSQDSEKQRRRDAELRSFDERIAEHLETMRRSGGLRNVPGYGRPLAGIEGWDETPAEFRLGFRILKNAGVVPPEVDLFHRRAALRRELAECRSPAEREALSARLTELEQVITMRLEALRATGSL